MMDPSDPSDPRDPADDAVTDPITFVHPRRWSVRTPLTSRAVALDAPPVVASAAGVPASVIEDIRAATARGAVAGARAVERALYGRSTAVRTRILSAAQHEIAALARSLRTLDDDDARAAIHALARATTGAGDSVRLITDPIGDALITSPRAAVAIIADALRSWTARGNDSTFGKALAARAAEIDELQATTDSWRLAVALADAVEFVDDTTT